MGRRVMLVEGKRKVIINIIGMSIYMGVKAGGPMMSTPYC